MGSNLAGYLYASVRNKVFDLFAREQVKGRYLESLGAFMEGYGGEPADYRVRGRQLQEYVDSQVAELPPKMRRIFELSRKAHLSHREIAEELGTTEGNVSKQVTNALRILRTKLGAWMVWWWLSVACWLLMVVLGEVRLPVLVSMMRMMLNF